MNTENHLNNPYAAVLADLLAKRDEIDKAIKVLEAMSGIRSFSLASTPQQLSTPATSDSADGQLSSDLGKGAFLGMSIVDATKKLLAMRKQTMGNPEIARELAAGGLVMQSIDPVNTVGAVLSRQFHKSGEIVKVSRGTWGLKEWYPNQSFKPSAKAASEPEIDAPNDTSLHDNLTQFGLEPPTQDGSDD